MIDFTTLSMFVLLVLVAVGLAGLFFGGDWLTHGSVGIALALHIPKVVVGLTVVSIATSAPELVTSLLAGARGSPGLAIGNIVGSNIANVGLILGIAALIMPFSIDPRLLKQDVPLLMGITLLFAFFSWGGLARWEGIVLLVITVGYLVMIVKHALIMRAAGKLAAEDIPEEVGEAPKSLGKAIALVVVGTLTLVFSANLLVDASVVIATRLGVSEVIIGITVVAFGTSLPELAATISAAMKKHSDLAAGNIVGSNLFNLILIGGALGTIFPVDVDPALFRWEYPSMLLVTALLWLFFATGKGINRWEGGGLLVCYTVIIGMACYWQFAA